MSAALNTALLAATLLAAGGCATAPPPGTEFVPLPAGAVLAYHRRSSGSYGEGEGDVRWTLGTRAWQGRTLVSSSSSNAGITLHDPQSHALVATLDSAGNPQASFEPPLNYAWPLALGKTWTTRHTITAYPSMRTLPMDMTWTVQAEEEVTVPAGRFKTWRVLITDTTGETQRVWMAPGQGLMVVKRELERSAAHRMGPGKLVGELTLVQRTP